MKMMFKFFVISITSMLLTIGVTGASTYAGSYAALGDSVAAGAGLTPPLNANAEDIACMRSTQAYPYQVAQQTNLTLMHIACSGATAGDLFTANRMNESTLVPQLDAAFSNGRPDLITITAGANDIYWAQVLRSCYVSNCADEISAQLASANMAALKVKLAYVFALIQLKSNDSPPPVIITGYYNPISNYCKNRQAYASNAEIDFLNKQRDNLNQTIRDAAAPYPFVKYASANFTNHGLCGPEPWSQSLNDPAPLHPTATGQSKIAESVLKAYNQ